MEMTKIKVNYKNLYIECIIAACFSALLLVLPIVLKWYDSCSLWFEILWNMCFALLFVAFVFGAIIRYQTASITNEFIVIQNAFGIIKKINWKDIYDVRIVNMIIGNAGAMILHKDWIVIQTSKEQCDPYLKPNRKKKGPWYIAATKENIETLQDYMCKCRPDILPLEP